MDENKAGTLMVHAGGHLVSRFDLEAIQPYTPEGTKTWKPVSHFRFVDQLTKALELRGHHVEREQFALSKDGGKMFGLFDIAGDTDGGVGVACGFRNSTDKSVSIRAYAGSRVFVCDNLAISGQSVVLARKHTCRLDLDLEVGRGVQKWEAEMNRFKGVMKKMAEVNLDETQARQLVYRAMIEEELMPLRLAHTVHDAYFGTLDKTVEGVDLDEKFEAWGGNTAWRLSNAFTYAAQEMPMMSRVRALQKVGQFFEAAVGAN